MSKIKNMTLKRARRLGLADSGRLGWIFFNIKSSYVSRWHVMSGKHFILFSNLEHGQKHAAEYKPMTGCFMTLGKKIYTWLCMKMTGNGHIQAYKILSSLRVSINDSSLG